MEKKINDIKVKQRNLESVINKIRIKKDMEKVIIEILLN